jgi:hypothetical protein
MFLGKVIKEHIKEDHIKQIAARAAWLGNDETHYVGHRGRQERQGRKVAGKHWVK